MLNPPSPDINILAAEVTWDISGDLPIISVVNKSEGAGLANVSWWFVATSPSSTLIHDGSESSPDINGDWTAYDITNGWPRPFNNIEFSAAPYVVTMYAKDSAGYIYSVQYSVSLCRPFGNTQNSTNAFGLASVDLSVKCESGGVYFKNTTNFSYQGISGDLNASTLRVIYPIDETQSPPYPFVINNFSVAIVPVTYSSDNYQFITQQYFTYDFGGGVFVKIRYQLLKRFPVYCNVNLSPLICEINKLVDDIESGSCTDAASANEKLLLINSKFAQVVIGILQPLSGVDVPEKIKEIEAIGGFECNCCSAPSGIIPTSASIVDGYSFSVNKLGGDVNGSFTTTGNNIVLNLSDRSYVFAIASSTLSQTTAFSVTNSISGDGFTKTYYLNVNVSTLASDLATAIGSNGTLLNDWRSMLGIGGGTTIIVDGGCIFQSSSTCNYYFSLTGIPANTTYAIFSGISINGVNQVKSYAFNQTNLTGLQSYLNAMGLGSWTVTNDGGGNISIDSTNNSNNITALTYSVSGTTHSASMLRECTGFTPITLDEFAANIVNYICSLSDATVKTSLGYEVCYIDAVGTVKTQIFDAGIPLQSLFSGLISNNCQTIQYIKSLGAVNCNSMKDLFTEESSLQITGQDFLLGTKGSGTCARVSPIDLFRYMLIATKSDVPTLNLFCETMEMCGAGKPCAPFSYYEIIVTDYDTNCTTATGIEYTLS